MKKIVTLLITFYLSILALFSQDSLHLSNRYDLGGVDRNMSIVTLSEDQFVLAVQNPIYIDFNNDGVATPLGLVLKLGNIVDNQIVLRDYHRIQETEQYNFQHSELTRMSSHRFMLTYNSNDSTTIHACEVAESGQITIGPSFALKEDYYSICSLVSVSEDKFLVAYYDAESDKPKCGLGTIINDLQIEMDTTYEVKNSTISNSSSISIDTLSKNQFVIAYGYFDGEVVVGSITEGNELMFGEPFQYAPAGASYNNVIAFSNSKFAVLYSDHDRNSRAAKLILGKTNDQLGADYSTPQIFNESGATNLKVARSDENEIFISFNSRLMKARLENDEVTFSEKVAFAENVQENGLKSLKKGACLLGYIDYPDFHGYLRIYDENVILEHSVPLFSATPLPIQYFPNPTNEVLIFRFIENMEIPTKIINLDGQIVLETLVTKEHSSIDVSSLKPGIYILKMNIDTRFSTSRIIIE